MCLDTEPETVALLKLFGHNVVAAPFGYREGIRYLPNPQHDFGLIVCDLRRPACFDVSKWGPYGGNDNYKCAVLRGEQVNWSSRYVGEGYNTPPREELIHRLIYETQIEHVNPASPFGPDDVLQAVALGGVPMVIFLNYEWVLRTGGYPFPAFVGVGWETGETNATKVRVLDPLAKFAAQWESPLEISTPVRCLLKSGPRTIIGRKDVVLASTSIVTDIGAMLGQFVRCGEGVIWLLPQTTNNAATACQFA